MRSLVDGLRRAARGGGGVGGDLRDERREALARVAVERAAGARQRHGLGEDVERGAAVHGRDGHDRGLERREAPRDDGLERRDDERRGDDGVARLVRRGRVPAGARDVDPELVDGGHHGAGRDARRAERERRPEVDAEDGVGAGVVEDAVGDHRGCAARALLGRLEREDDAAARGRVEQQKVGRRVEGGDVPVVPAGVHPAVRRRERQAGLLGDAAARRGRREEGRSGPGRPVSRTAATPVFPRPARTASPRARMRPATRRAVSTSSNAVSGRVWISRRSATAAASAAAASFESGFTPGS